METSSFKFNVLPFRPQDEHTFYFTDRAGEGLVRFAKGCVPREVIDHFGEQDYYHTSFAEARGDFLAVTRPTFGPEAGKAGKAGPVPGGFAVPILMAYYNGLIFNFFKDKKGCLVKPNFINATEVWVASSDGKKDERFWRLEKYSLQARLKKATEGWEIVLAYEGRARVLKQGVAALNGMNPALFNWVIFDRGLYRYKELPEAGLRALDQVFPVINFELGNELDLDLWKPSRENKYEKYWKKISWFYENHLENPAFKALIPLMPGGFIHVSKKRIGRVSEDSNILLFGEGAKVVKPYDGIIDHGPYDLEIPRKVHFFFILGKDDARAEEIIHGYLNGERSGFKGLHQFIRVPYFTEKSLRIVFENSEDPWPEIERGILNLALPADEQYFAIYISPFSKNETDGKRKSVYYRLKEMLLERGVLSQVVEAEKVTSDRSYHFSLPNIAVAILAKLGGTPWKLDIPLREELIVGVGAFKSELDGVKYIGSAFSFSNNGRFNRFECFRKDQVRELAGSILRAVDEYVRAHTGIRRLVIHYYKEMSRRESHYLEKGLRNLGLDIPVFIVTINKTESEDIVAFDHSWPGLMPLSGTFIRLGFNQFLLFNNTRYTEGPFQASNGYPFPIKLKISCTDCDLARDYQLVRELIDQVYQFSRMYWKSIKQQNLPVTIKYPELIAGMIPHFQGTEIPGYGKDRLWFL